jgi:hypothetical protein
VRFRGLTINLLLTQIDPTIDETMKMTPATLTTMAKMSRTARSGTNDVLVNDTFINDVLVNSTLINNVDRSPADTPMSSHVSGPR